MALQGDRGGEGDGVPVQGVARRGQGRGHDVVGSIAYQDEEVVSGLACGTGEGKREQM